MAGVMAIWGRSSLETLTGYARMAADFFRKSGAGQLRQHRVTRCRCRRHEKRSCPERERGVGETHIQPRVEDRGCQPCERSGCDGGAGRHGPGPRPACVTCFIRGRPYRQIVDSSEYGSSWRAADLTCRTARAKRLIRPPTGKAASDASDATTPAKDGRCVAIMFACQKGWRRVASCQD